MKKSNYIIYFAILMISLITDQTVFADGSRKAGVKGNDVKIKTRQTVSGQTYENTTYIKGKRQRTEQDMGGMQTVNITQCDLKRGLQIMPQSQTYLVDVWETGATANAPASAPGKSAPKTKGGVITSTFTTKDTGERKQMFGYTARHIITTMESNSSPDACNVSKSKMEIDGWYIDAAFALDCANDRYSNYRAPVADGGCQDRYESKQIGAAVKKGYPVLEKMTMFDQSGKETTTILSEVVELSGATLDAALFEAPSGYREVKNTTELYASMANNNSSSGMSSNRPTNAYGANTNPEGAAMNANIQGMSKSSANVPTRVGAKSEGMIRIGLAQVKTGAVGEGLNAAELAGAVQNSLSEYVKAPNVELVLIEAKLATAIAAEAKSKDCDFVIYANVSHKKGGGGGFGMFKKIAPVLGNVVPMAGVSTSVAGAIAGQVASTAIYTAAGMATNVKSKDEVTLDIKVEMANAATAGGSTVLAKQFKQKAKGDGDDILTPIIEQAAEAILNATTQR